MTNTSIMLVGVGGQGTLLASKILGNVAIQQGYDVKMSEVHGMAQRGGSVVTYVKFGEKIYSPIIEKGTADYMLAFEKLEGYRWMPYLKKDGQLIINTQQIEPMPVITGATDYPAGIIDKLKADSSSLISLDALALAKEAGTAKAINVVLLGVLAKVIEIDKEVWLKAIELSVPERFIEVNKKAFELGYTSMSK